MITYSCHMSLLTSLGRLVCRVCHGPLPGPQFFGQQLRAQGMLFRTLGTSTRPSPSSLPG